MVFSFIGHEQNVFYCWGIWQNCYIYGYEMLSSIASIGYNESSFVKEDDWKLQYKYLWHEY